MEKFIFHLKTEVIGYLGTKRLFSYWVCVNVTTRTLVSGFSAHTFLSLPHPHPNNTHSTPQQTINIPDHGLLLFSPSIVAVQPLTKVKNKWVGERVLWAASSTPSLSTQGKGKFATDILNSIRICPAQFDYISLLKNH